MGEADASPRREEVESERWGRGMEEVEIEGSTRGREELMKV